MVQLFKFKLSSLDNLSIKLLETSPFTAKTILKLFKKLLNTLTSKFKTWIRKSG